MISKKITTASEPNYCYICDARWPKGAEIVILENHELIVTMDLRCYDFLKKIL